MKYRIREHRGKFYIEVLANVYVRKRERFFLPDIYEKEDVWVRANYYGQPVTNFEQRNGRRRSSYPFYDFDCTDEAHATLDRAKARIILWQTPDKIYEITNP
jgi:hypothetical protein